MKLRSSLVELLQAVAGTWSEARTLEADLARAGLGPDGAAARAAIAARISAGTPRPRTGLTTRAPRPVVGGALRT